MNKRVPSRRAPQSWIDAIEQSAVDLAAGRTLDFEEVMRAFDAEDAALEAAGKTSGSKSDRSSAVR